MEVQIICKERQSQILNVIIQIIKSVEERKKYFQKMKTPVIQSCLKSSQLRSSSHVNEGRKNRINSIQIVKNSNKSTNSNIVISNFRCGTFSLPKTQPTKNSSTHSVIANCEETDMIIRTKIQESPIHNNGSRIKEFYICKNNECQPSILAISNDEKEKDQKYIHEKLNTDQQIFKKKNINANIDKQIKEWVQEQIQTCPQIQVTQFCRNLDKSFYLHKVDIDYGRLNEPITCLNKGIKQIITNPKNKKSDIKVMETNKYGNEEQQKQNYWQNDQGQQIQTLRNIKIMRNTEQQTTQKPKKLKQQFREVKSTELIISSRNDKVPFFNEEKGYDQIRSRQSKQDRQIRWDKQIKEMKESFIKILNNSQQPKLISKPFWITKCKKQKYPIVNDLFLDNSNISNSNTNIKANYKEYFCPKLKQIVAKKPSNKTTINDTQSNSLKSIKKTNSNSLNKISMQSGSEYEIPQQENLIQPLPKCISFSQQSTNRYHHQNTQVKSKGLGNESRRQRQGNNKSSLLTNHFPHCRIIRSYVGGGKMQIKIISYPDNSEYMRVCGHENSNKKRK